MSNCIVESPYLNHYRTGRKESRLTHLKIPAFVSLSYSETAKPDYNEQGRMELSSGSGERLVVSII
jgi:hypothetical protein